MGVQLPLSVTSFGSIPLVAYTCLVWVGLNLKLLHLVAFEVEVLILQHGVALLGIDLILFRSVLLGFFPCSSANMEREAKVDKVSMWFFGLDAMLEEPTTFDGEACEPAPLQGAFAGCKRLQVSFGWEFWGQMFLSFFFLMPHPGNFYSELRISALLPAV